MSRSVVCSAGETDREKEEKENAREQNKGAVATIDANQSEHLLSNSLGLKLRLFNLLFSITHSLADSLELGLR